MQLIDKGGGSCRSRASYVVAGGQMGRRTVGSPHHFLLAEVRSSPSQLHPNLLGWNRMSIDRASHQLSGSSVHKFRLESKIISN